MTDVMQMSQSYSQYSNLYAYQQQVCPFFQLLAKCFAAQKRFEGTWYHHHFFLNWACEDLDFMERFSTTQSYV